MVTPRALSFVSTAFTTESTFFTITDMVWFCAKSFAAWVNSAAVAPDFFRVAAGSYFPSSLRLLKPELLNTAAFCASVVADA